MTNYETLSDAIHDLTLRGYTLNFNLAQDALHCAEHDLLLHPESFEVDEWYRFQQMSDVDDETILYAISSKDGTHKGLLVNAFGIYAEKASAALEAKLSLR